MVDFDTVIDRSNTNSVKWDSISETYGKENLLPLWVADMDFMSPGPVVQALTDFAKNGLYGYTVTPDSLFQGVINWQKKHFGYELNKEEIIFSPGVVSSIGIAIQAFTEPGDAVLIHDPVYPPFAEMITANHRQLIRSKLIEKDGYFAMDFADMEAQIMKHDVKLIILCNPHNPGGRVWHQDELQILGELCQKHQVKVVSDEIHEDIVFRPHHHVSFQTVHPDFADFSIVLAAPTKTFNLAGLKNSMVFIKNPQLRKRYIDIQHLTSHNPINTFGMIGTEAAYQNGESWLEELLTYLEENLSFACDFFAEKMPQLRVMKPQGTYLLWLDFSNYGLTDRQLGNKLINEAQVVLNPGITFGPEGSSHMRLNFACARTILAQGLEQIAAAFTD